MDQSGQDLGRDARLADVEAELQSRDLLIEQLRHQLAGMPRIGSAPPPRPSASWN